MMKVLYLANLVVLGVLLGAPPTTTRRRLSDIEPENVFQWPNGATIDMTTWRGDELQDDDRVMRTAKEARIHMPNGSTVEQIIQMSQRLHDDGAEKGTDYGNSKPGIDHPDYYSGWIEYVGYEATGNVTHMSARFAVPPPPPAYNILTTIFLFAGLEENDHHNVPDILQPVLQYGHSGCGGGKHWSAASYYVVGITAHCGGTLHLEQGDVIEANMTYGKVDNTWTLTTTLLSRKTEPPPSRHDEKGREMAASQSILHVKVDHAYHWAMVTLEAIRVYSCKTYPGGSGTQFGDMVVKVNDVTVQSPSWKKNITHTDCGQSVDIIDSRTTVLHYNATVAG